MANDFWPVCTNASYIMWLIDHPTDPQARRTNTILSNKNSGLLVADRLAKKYPCLFFALSLWHDCLILNPTGLAARHTSRERISVARDMNRRVRT